MTCLPELQVPHVTSLRVALGWQISSGQQFLSSILSASMVRNPLALKPAQWVFRAEGVTRTFVLSNDSACCFGNFLGMCLVNSSLQKFVTWSFHLSKLIGHDLLGLDVHEIVSGMNKWPII